MNNATDYAAGNVIKFLKKKRIRLRYAYVCVLYWLELCKIIMLYLIVRNAAIP